MISPMLGNLGKLGRFVDCHFLMQRIDQFKSVLHILIPIVSGREELEPLINDQARLQQ